MTLNETDILNCLVHRGLLEPGTRLQPLAGNADRHPKRTRSHWLAHQPTGPRLKLTAGSNLVPLRERSEAQAGEIPSACAGTKFFVREGHTDVLAVEAIDGDIAESLDRDASAVARLLAALLQLESVLDRTREPFDPHLFAQEWASFADAVLCLPIWAQSDRVLMRETLLPILRSRLQERCTANRWTNGDFISSNVCVREDGTPILFDAEYAARTHFFPEDTVRFQRISPIAGRHPALFNDWWSHSDPVWEVFFQLRQLVLEHRENTSAYNEVTTPARLGAVRFFASSWTNAFPNHWPRPQTPQPSFPSETLHFFWHRRGGKFCAAQSTQVNVRSGTRQFASFRVTDRQAERWRLDPASTCRPILVHALIPVTPIPARGAAISIPFSVHGAKAVEHEQGTLLEPSGNDPQLHFVVPNGCVALVAELTCL